MARQAHYTTDMVTLRPYQSDAVNGVMNDLFNINAKSSLIVAATGTGKTTTGSEIIQRILNLGSARRVLVLVHRYELLDQFAKRLVLFGMKPGLECGGKKSRGERVVVGSVQSLVRRLTKFARDHFDAIVVDECHHAAAAGYRKIFDYFTKAKIIGLTATPDRSDGVGLACVFERLAARYDIAQAVQEGNLVPVRGIQIEVPGLDLSKVRQKVIRHNKPVKTPDQGWGNLGQRQQHEVRDLHPGDLGKAAIAPEAVEGVTGPLVELVRDMPGVIFCVDVAHAMAVATSLNARLRRPNHDANGLQIGIARYVHGDLDKSERAEILEAFARGEFQFLVNVMVLTEGWDSPRVKFVAMARPTQSRVLFAQACGRGLRLMGNTLAESIAAGKSECLVLDFVGVSCEFKLVGPDDVLAGAMIAPTVVIKAKRAAPRHVPQDLYVIRPETKKVSFITKIVDLFGKVFK
jgi:superfamily II DNA or RNA helicase